MVESVSGSQSSSDEDDSDESAISGHMIQAVFSMLWSTVVMELWKRRSASLSYRWGTVNLAERFAEPRPGFHGELGVNPVTGRVEPLFPEWQRDLRIALLSIPVVGLFLGRTFSQHFIHVCMFTELKMNKVLLLLLQGWWCWVCFVSTGERPRCEASTKTGTPCCLRLCFTCPQCFTSATQTCWRLFTRRWRSL